MRFNAPPAAPALFTAVVLIVLGGCHSTTHVAQPLAPELAKSDPDSQVEFWHTLPNHKAVSNDEAFHGLLLFADGDDPSADYAGRVETLKQRRMLPGGFNAAAGEPVRRGTVAVALAQVLSIRGGLTMHLFGSSPRYAVRELQYAGLFPPSSPQQTFSGAEFLGIIGRAEDYQRAQTPADELTPPAAEAASDTGGGV
jgi:hypothetical protein